MSTVVVTPPEQDRGPRPFGWRWTRPDPGNPARPLRGSRARLVVHVGEAAMVLAMFVMVEGGDSLRSAARAMRDAGFTGTLGAPPSPQTVRPILTQPRHAGLVNRDGYLVPGAPDAPRIVPVSTFLAVQQRLSDPARRTAPTTATVTLLSGIARCGRCGGPMNATNRHSGDRPPVAVYACSRYRHLARRRDLLDPVVIRAVERHLADAADRDPAAAAAWRTWRVATTHDADLPTARAILGHVVWSVDVEPVAAGRRPGPQDVRITWVDPPRPTMPA